MPWPISYSVTPRAMSTDPLSSTLTPRASLLTLEQALERLISATLAFPAADAQSVSTFDALGRGGNAHASTVVAVEHLSLDGVYQALRRFFDEAPFTAFTLVEQQTADTGVLVATYRLVSNDRHRDLDAPAT